jgi:hypothetical protein
LVLPSHTPQALLLLISTARSGVLYIIPSLYSDYATYWMTKESEFDSRQGQDIFLFSTAFRPVLGPTQPPNQWGDFPGGKAAGPWSWPLTSI